MQAIQQFNMLEIAGNMIAYYDNQDRLRPSLLELTGVHRHGMATLSGLSDYDYQNLSTLSLGHKQLNQIRTVNKSSIPTEILEHFKHIKCHCIMGLFPEIGRAWLTIDSEIYIWTFEKSRDVAYYDGLNHLVVSVGLVKPRSGVFVNEVKYLLLLTTPIEIVVLGVTFGISRTSPHEDVQNTTNLDEMQLMNKPIFVLGTDNVSINVVKGSNDGRIFLGGRDGCLYEIYYQAGSSWFGKRCKKVNHSQGIVSYIMPSFLKVFMENDPIQQISIDNSRNLLYVLTEKGAIEAWDMGIDYTTMRRLCRITQNEIINRSVNIVKTVDINAFKLVKAICPITKDDCENFHLLAITQCGVRLYFSTVSLNFTQNNAEFQTQQSQCQNQQQSIQPMQPTSQASIDIQRPHGLFLLHLRIPPGYTPNTTTNKPKNVHAAYFNDGTLLMVSTPQQDQDSLWSISSSAFQNLHYLVESASVEALDGIVWSLAEMKDRSQVKLRSLLHNARTPKNIALLTNQGTHILALLKPVDLLYQLLISCNGPHHEAVKAFFQSQSEREACVICLLLATSDEYKGSDIATWAIQAFMLYGGEPIYQHQQNTISPAFVNRQSLNSSSGANTVADRYQPQMFMSTPMANTGFISATVQRPVMQNYQYSISPIGQNAYISNVPTIKEPSNMIYSAKHDGLYLYVARLMRPIWNLNCVNEHLCSNLTKDGCKFMLKDLCSLRAFLDAHSVHDLSSNIYSSYNNQPVTSNCYNSLMVPNNSLPTNEQRSITEQAQVEEKRSLTALNGFIKHACEVLSLWNILTEHHFQYIAMQLNADQQEKLKLMTFRDITVTRSEVCISLIISLINIYLKDNAGVSGISTMLREVCPNLYRNEDAVAYKATEILMSAKNSNSASSREQKLRAALQMCVEAAPTLPLHSICQQFICADFFEGVIKLSATCAEKNDPEELGIHYYNNEEPSDDREGYNSFASRMTCYKEVSLLLDQVYKAYSNVQNNQEQSHNNYHQEIMDQNDCKQTILNTEILKVVSQALRVKDVLMHITVYEWLMVHDMRSELLNLVEPSLGEFLRRSANRSTENLKLIDLLWKYYEKNGHHADAAKILDNLATTQNSNISLDQRIEYLVRAVMCMRNESVGASANNGLFLKELEDKLDIARVQKSVLNSISELAHSNANATRAVDELNCTLYDITQLYQKFAEPFELWECQLLILNCSHHNDPLLIESVWGNIINKAVEGPGTAMERSTRLFSKIESLVREFGESGHCFPFSFLIHELEIKACQLRLPEGIVPEKLVAMNLDTELILEYYSRMISLNERVWANEGNEWHLIQSAICVVTLLANNSHTIWYRSKRRIIGKALDIIAVCLNICYQKPDTDLLQKQFKDLQNRLQRLLT